MSSFLEISCHTFLVQIWSLCIFSVLLYKLGLDQTSSMSSSILYGFKDGVLFAIVADYQVIICSDLSSQMLQNTLRYTGKPIYGTSSSGIPHAFLQCGAEKIEHFFDFFTRLANHPRGFRENGNDTWIQRRLDNMASARVPARIHPRGLNLTNGNRPLGQ